MFSVRIVDADFYVTKPLRGLDVIHSEFRGADVKKVPVLRIFGSTPSGQKTCLHVHQVFPYIYVPYDGTQPSKKYLKQLCTSIDFALQVALGKTTSSTHHVYDATIVKRIPFYGYHESEQDFIKIQFYNPRMLTRAVDLLQNGAILNQVFQPFEAHIPYILQFFIDFNLYGMNLLHAKTVKFRGWNSNGSMATQSTPSTETCSTQFSPNLSGSFHVAITSSQHWNEDTVPHDLRLNTDVAKISKCELEVDVISCDILNQMEYGTNVGTNPGIMAMWEDEKQRRRNLEQCSQISIPISQDREEIPMFDLERNFKKRIRDIITERNQLIQSQLDGMERSQIDSLSPEDFRELSQSILFDAKELERSPKLLQKFPAQISDDVDENTPVVDETVIEDVLQTSQSQPLSCDQQIFDMLQALAADPNEILEQECSPTSKLPSIMTMEQQDGGDESGDDDDNVSMVMSQPVWDDEDDMVDNHSQRDDENEEHSSLPQRIPQLDGTADSDTNNENDTGVTPNIFGRNTPYNIKAGSFGCIPQLDGCHDEDDVSEGHATKQDIAEVSKASCSTSVKTDKNEPLDTNAKEAANGKRKSIVAPLLVTGGNTRARKTEIKRKQSKKESKMKTQTSEKRNKNRSKNKQTCKLDISGGKAVKPDETLLKNTESETSFLNREAWDFPLCSIQQMITNVQTSLTDNNAKQVGPENLDSIEVASLVQKPPVEQSFDMESQEKNYTKLSNEYKGKKKRSSRKLVIKKQTKRILQPDLKVDVSSESQASDFELRLSDSSGDDFKISSKKKSKVTKSLGKPPSDNTTTYIKNMKKTVKKSDSENTTTFEKTKTVHDFQKTLKRKRRRTGENNVSVKRIKIVEGSMKRNLEKYGYILLDACVALEKLPREGTKPRGDIAGQVKVMVDKDDVGDGETIHHFSSGCSTNDDEENLSNNSLFQMGMWSPNSCHGDNSSPPVPSSPTLDVHNLVTDLVDSPVICDKEGNNDRYTSMEHCKCELQTQKQATVFADGGITGDKDSNDGVCWSGGSYKGVNVGYKVTSSSHSGGIPDVIDNNDGVSLSSVDSGGDSVLVDDGGGQRDTNSVGNIEGSNRSLSGGRLKVLNELVIKDHHRIINKDLSQVAYIDPTIMTRNAQSQPQTAEGLWVQQQYDSAMENLDDIKTAQYNVKIEPDDTDGSHSGISNISESFCSCDEDEDEVIGGDIDQHHLMTSSASPMGVVSQEHPPRVWCPVNSPPSLEYILETRDMYGLPYERHQKAFCSNSKDLPIKSRTAGGRRIDLVSLSSEDLAEFQTGVNTCQTLVEIRNLMGEQMDSSFVKGCLRTLDTTEINNDEEYSGDRVQIKLALMGDHDVIITPVQPPPSRDMVCKWMEKKRLKTGSGQDLMKITSEPEEANEESKKMDTPAHVTRQSKSLNNINSDFHENMENLPSPLHTPSGPSSRLYDLGGSVGVPSGPQHSTPMGVESRSRKLFQGTPDEEIGSETKKKEMDITFISDDRCLKVENLRRNILSSQGKINVGKKQSQLSINASYIEGPTPDNSCGFKISQPNIQDAKTLHERQYLTLLSIEVHVRTRKELRPDPEYDPICAIFYNIENETKEEKQNVTGVIISMNESTKLNKTDSSDEASTSVRQGPSETTQNIAVPKGIGNLLKSTGINHEIDVVNVEQETDAILKLIELVHKWDPDFLIGFEVQMLSLGYLLQRSSILGIDLASKLSRLNDESGTNQFDAKKDKWGASYTSEITIAGRIVLNVWRLMKHEITLNIYSFENIAYHVLRERIPLYTFEQLSKWWDQKLPHNRWRTAEHYITRCQSNIRILNHSDLINRTSEFARLFGIRFFSVLSRGSQYRVESMMLRLAKPMNYVAVSPSIKQRARMDAPECIPLVMEPESRFYTDPVVVLDFQSLYPSIIIAYNYCFSTCLGKVSRLDELGNFVFGCTSLNISPSLLQKLEEDIHVSANGAAFVKPNVRRGILPRMLKEILDTRVMVKTAMKLHKQDRVLGRLLDARQLGLKLIANVTYGYTSANFSGRMPCVEIADAIVRKARETLERAIELVNTKEEWGARVVYGDTDSLFVLMKGATKERAFEIGKAIVDAVTAENPKPVKLKFEKVFLPCVLQTKKRYVGYMYETLDQKEAVFDAKGIETVRRDTCPAVSKILEKSLRILFETKDVSLVKKFVQRQFRKMMEDRVSLQDFIFAKEYRGLNSYKPTACVPALELTRRRLSRDRRAEPRVGERVPYVIVCGSPGLPLIQLVRSPEEVLKDQGLRLNTSYYINKQILPPLNRAFFLMGVDVFTWYTELPKFIPRQQQTTSKSKGTISRYFTTLHCPVCEKLTNQGLCYDCRRDPQKASVTLADRTRNWERKYDHISQICYQCGGTRDPDLTCVSLDCPVLFKLRKMTQKLSYGETLRDVQLKIQNNTI